MELHLCGNCWLKKPESEFHKSNSSPSGLQNYCKLCKKRETDRNAQRKYRNKKKRIKRTGPLDVSHISFKNLNFEKDHPECLKLLQIIGYDITQDIHEQFLKRVLMRSGEVLKKGEQPIDKISHHYIKKGPISETL